MVLKSFPRPLLVLIEKITFCGDVKIIVQTVLKAFIKREGINREGTVNIELGIMLQIN